MRKKQIKEIAIKLEWEIEEVLEAVNNLLKGESIIKDWNKFFKLCVDTKNPEERWERVRKSIYNQIPNNGLVESICKCLYFPDPCFTVCALFNMSDMKKGSSVMNCNLAYAIWRNHKERKSFEIVVHCDRDTYWPHLFFEPALDSVTLCNHFFTWVICDKVKNRQSILRDIVTRTGFLAFNINAFRVIASDFIFYPQKTSLAKQLARDFSQYLNNSSRKEREYWGYYVLCEKLREYGYKPMKSFEEVAIRVEKSSRKKATIKTRYQERKRKLKEIKASNPSYDIKNIISDFNLQPYLKKYLPEYTQSSMSVDMSVTQT
ncbi:hypothetical protein MYX76_15055 [Desulfobacterota bacterium AH_259_B03_O07]|nr:hypothetical protein [Desulfobacterota bacterium AH_259_B03_O07]